MIITKLDKKPKDVTIIEGFPGIGLIGTIASEYLVEHLGCEQIGSMLHTKMPAMTAIHNQAVVPPIGIYYCKSKNLVLIHGIGATQGIEWDISEEILKVAKELKAKEIISLEGVGTMEAEPEPTSDKVNTFYFTSGKSEGKKFEKMGCTPLKEGIIMGVTGSMLVNSIKKVTMSSLFAETHSNMPDSKAAAEVIAKVSEYLGIKIDVKPLIQQAEKFEGKLKTILENGGKATVEQERKKMSYVG